TRVAAHAAPRFDPNKKISQSTSSNWSGYSAVHGRYTSVSANWKQPSASCTSATTYSSFWVGLDGDGSNTVEQTGTSADCSGGVLPLTNFGTVSFSSTTVNGQPIGNFNPDKIDMVSGSTVKAQTSSLSGGTNFSVAWKHS